MIYIFFVATYNLSLIHKSIYKFIRNYYHYKELAATLVSYTR